MLAIRSTIPATPPPAPRGSEWLTVSEAAQRSGMSERQISRMCGAKWFALGVARQDRIDGRLQWLIRTDADSRLARVKFADDQPADLKHLSDQQRELLRWKKAVLAEWDAFANAEQFRRMTREQVDQCFVQMLAAGKLKVKLLPTMKLPPTDRTLRRWRKQAGGGLLGLVDGRATRYEDEPGAEDPFFEFFKSVYLKQQKPDLRFCWRMACYQASQSGWMPRSEPQTRRFVKTIPKAVATLFRGGPKAYNDQCSPYIERDYSDLRINQIWNADHHQFDVWVMHEGRQVRPWLTAFQDVRSRKIVGWFISPEGGNTDTILAAMVAAIDDAGLPERCYFDLGRDFASKAIGGVSRKHRFGGKAVLLKAIEERISSVCGDLNIEVTHCQAYHGQSKPIERVFGTMSQFTKSQSTYCGNTTVNRPENLPAKLARGAAAELSDFMESFQLWVNWHNECDQHQGDGMNGKSPAVVFSELRTEKRVIAQAIRTVMFWKPGPLTKVGRNGVRCNRLTYELDEAAWLQWQGQQVSVRVDPQDVNRAAICGPDGRFICLAACRQKLPFNATAEQKAKAIATIKRRKKAVRDYHEMRPRLSNDVAEEMWQQQADESRRRREASAAEVPLVKVSTPMNEDLTKIQRALDGPSKTMRLANEGEPADEPLINPHRPMTFTELMAPISRKLDEELAKERADTVDPWKLLAKTLDQDREAE